MVFLPACLASSTARLARSMPHFSISSENAAAPFEDTRFAPQSTNILAVAAWGMIRRTIDKETGAFFTKKKTPGFCVKVALANLLFKCFGFPAPKPRPTKRL